MAGEAANRYARAAFELALESGKIAPWRSALEDIAVVFSESEAQDYFSDTRVSLEDRLKGVERVLDLPPLALNLARVMVTHGRSHDARAVATAFNALADDYEGIEHAQLTTAIPLAPGQVKEIAERLGKAIGKQVLATAVVDPAIVGGIIVRVGDHLMDGSVRTRLRTLRRELEGAR